MSYLNTKLETELNKLEYEAKRVNGLDTDMLVRASRVYGRSGPPQALHLLRNYKRLERIKKRLSEEIQHNRRKGDEIQLARQQCNLSLDDFGDCVFYQEEGPITEEDISRCEGIEKIKSLYGITDIEDVLGLLGSPDSELSLRVNPTWMYSSFDFDTANKIRINWFFRNQGCALPVSIPKSGA